MCWVLGFLFVAPLHSQLLHLHFFNFEHPQNGNKTSARLVLKQQQTRPQKAKKPFILLKLDLKNITITNNPSAWLLTIWATCTQKKKKLSFLQFLYTYSCATHVLKGISYIAFFFGGTVSWHFWPSSFWKEGQLGHLSYADMANWRDTQGETLEMLKLRRNPFGGFNQSELKHTYIYSLILITGNLHQIGLKMKVFLNN